MNLTVEPWIPALHAVCRRELFSLHNVFAHAHELRELAVKPHERIALNLWNWETLFATNGPTGILTFGASEQMTASQPFCRIVLGP